MASVHQRRCLWRRLHSAALPWVALAVAATTPARAAVTCYGPGRQNGDYILTASASDVALLNQRFTAAHPLNSCSSSSTCFCFGTNSFSQLILSCPYCVAQPRNGCNPYQQWLNGELSAAGFNTTGDTECFVVSTYAAMTFFRRCFVSAGPNGATCARAVTGLNDLINMWIAQDNSTAPTGSPTAAPTATPTAAPTGGPTAAPTVVPTDAPTRFRTPRVSPTAAPSTSPTTAPSAEPTASPVAEPTAHPTASPTLAPSGAPTGVTTSVRPGAVTDVLDGASTTQPTVVVGAVASTTPPQTGGPGDAGGSASSGVLVAVVVAVLAVCAVAFSALAVRRRRDKHDPSRPAVANPTYDEGGLSRGGGQGAPKVAKASNGAPMAVNGAFMVSQGGVVYEVPMATDTAAPANQPYSAPAGASDGGPSVTNAGRRGSSGGHGSNDKDDGRDTAMGSEPPDATYGPYEVPVSGVSFGPYEHPVPGAQASYAIAHEPSPAAYDLAAAGSLLNVYNTFQDPPEHKEATASGDAAQPTYAAPPSVGRQGPAAAYDLAAAGSPLNVYNTFQDPPEHKEATASGDAAQPTYAAPASDAREGPAESNTYRVFLSPAEDAAYATGTETSL